MTAQIIQFPPQRTCFNCQHYDDEFTGCMLFDKPVEPARDAQRCHGFEAV